MSRPDNLRSVPCTRCGRPMWVKFDVPQSFIDIMVCKHCAEVLEMWNEGSTSLVWVG